RGHGRLQDIVGTFDVDPVDLLERRLGRYPAEVHDRVHAVAERAHGIGVGHVQHLDAVIAGRPQVGTAYHMPGPGQWFGEHPADVAGGAGDKYIHAQTIEGGRRPPSVVRCSTATG